MRLEWDAKYSINIGKFDEHHKKFFKILNDLYEAPLGDNTGLAELIDAMSDYARVHFGEEEEAMRETDFPDLHAHAAQHIRFVKYLAKFRKKMKDTPKRTIKDKLEFFSIWVAGHIGGWDKDMAAYLLEKGYSPPA